MSLDPKLFGEDFASYIQKVKNNVSRKMETMIPCSVTAVNDARTFVTVQPLIKIVTADGTYKSRGEIPHLQVMTLGGGGFCLTFPIKVGNLGWIEASDRDLSIFYQEYAEVIPGSRRMHSFSDARFIPDVMTGFTLSSDDTTGVCLQNIGGTIKVVVDTSEVRIINGDNVSVTATASEINAKVSTSSIDMTASELTATVGSSTVDMTSSEITATSTTISLNGFTIDSSGNWTTPSGSTSSDGDVTTSSGISLDDHTHTVENVEGGTSSIETDAATGS